jgi:hypothetical protein
VLRAEFVSVLAGCTRAPFQCYAEKAVESVLTAPAQIEVVHTSTADIWIGDDGIVRVIIKPGARIGIDEAHEPFSAIPQASEGLSPILVDIRRMHSIDRQARAFFREREGRSALALIVGSPLTRAIGNFAIGIDRPKVPTRLFTSAEEAHAWLKQFVRR